MITLKLFDAGEVRLCRNETGEAVVHCSNTACPILSYHLSCLKLTGVPKKWMCPLCHKGSSPPQKSQRPARSDDTTKKAVDIDTAICVCNQKATHNDKLIECHNNPYIMEICSKPNNAKTTWICPDCSGANPHDTKAKVKVTNVNHVHASIIVSTPKNGNLNNYHYQLICRLLDG